MIANSLPEWQSEHQAGANSVHTTPRPFLTTLSLSVVLPAYNEAAIISQTVVSVIAALIPWVEDFEVIVVNDGSKDDTQAVLEALADPHLRVIEHKVNCGYGAALITGFAAATKDLTFFMDSDGQFDISDIKAFFPLIEQYDAVLGYRLQRRDRWIRKVNAWGWKSLIRLMLHVNARDVDCAFKLYRTDFLQHCHLETQGAMINTEILYKLHCFGHTYVQVGVHHHFRESGRATGANIPVILRAFQELFLYARKWSKEKPQK